MRLLLCSLALLAALGRRSFSGEAAVVGSAAFPPGGCCWLRRLPCAEPVLQPSSAGSGVAAEALGRRGRGESRPGSLHGVWACTWLRGRLRGGAPRRKAGTPEGAEPRRSQRLMDAKLEAEAAPSTAASPEAMAIDESPTPPPKPRRGRRALRAEGQPPPLPASPPEAIEMKDAPLGPQGVRSEPNDLVPSVLREHAGGDSSSGEASGGGVLGWADAPPVPYRVDPVDADRVYKEMAKAKLPSWPREPPQGVVDREYTLEEDLALVRAVEDEMRRACEAGDVEKVKELLQQGATFEDWDNVTETCVDTMFDAQWEVWEEQRTGQPANLTQIREEDDRRRSLIRGIGLSSSHSDETPEEHFLDTHFTGELRAELNQEPDTKALRKFQREAMDFCRADAYDVEAIQDQKHKLDFLTFRPGDEDKDSEEEDEDEDSAMEGWVDPFGKKMNKVQLALRRNGTDELDSEEKEMATWLEAPCDALQSLMSESESEHEGHVLEIPKFATEITPGDLDPWNKGSDMRLSAGFGRKEFDLIDTLGGFERSTTGTGVKSADQNYRQVRSRFLGSEQGSYKRISQMPLSMRKKQL